MCWLDKKSIAQILKLRDEFRITTFVETGTFKGVNARFHSSNFKEVLTCDISEEYLVRARSRLEGCPNVLVYRESSPVFLKNFVSEYRIRNRRDIVFFYLDAHFYDPGLPPDQKWVVANELKAIKGFTSCIVCIHDFDCEGLGHCVYDGESLGFSLVGKYLTEVNPSFSFYTNSREYSEIYDENTIAGVPGIVLDEDTLDNIKYANSSERLRTRGILYCTPRELDLNNYELKKLGA